MALRRFMQHIRRAMHDWRRGSAWPSSQVTKEQLAELRAGGLVPPRDAQVYDQVRAKTVADLADLLATALSLSEAAQRLGVDSSRVRQLLSDRQLLAIKAGGEWRILDIMFIGPRLVPNIGVVVQALPRELPVLAAATWLTTPNSDLELDGKPVSPLEWLRAGGDARRARRLAADL
jgi:excisionase family DNA binding protein